MNQDYQLSTHSQANGDFWTQNGSGILANAGIANPGYASAGSLPVLQGLPQSMSPMKKAHRLLRGRYPLAFLLSASGLPAGGVAGYIAQCQPKFESAGVDSRSIPCRSAPAASTILSRWLSMWIRPAGGPDHPEHSGG